jgi:hypothetical protein
MSKGLLSTVGYVTEEAVIERPNNPEVKIKTKRFIISGFKYFYVKNKSCAKNKILISNTQMTTLKNKEITTFAAQNRILCTEHTVVEY